MGSTVQQHHVHAVETVGSDTSPLQQNTSCTATRLETSGSLQRVSLGAIREQDVGADATQQSNSQLGKQPDERMTTGVGTSPRRKNTSLGVWLERRQRSGRWRAGDEEESLPLWSESPERRQEAGTRTRRPPASLRLSGPGGNPSLPESQKHRQKELVPS